MVRIEFGGQAVFIAGLAARPSVLCPVDLLAYLSTNSLSLCRVKRAVTGPLFAIPQIFFGSFLGPLGLMCY